jgi:hypothetical protein
LKDAIADYCSFLFIYWVFNFCEETQFFAGYCIADISPYLKPLTVLALVTTAKVAGSNFVNSPWNHSPHGYDARA